MENFDIVDEIYNEIFCNIQHGNIDLFLCGAASTKEKTSYRDIIRGKLEDNANLSILYPEDMFMEMLNRKKYDLLTLEKFLASNSDIILIVCESPGSFTELGAFVNNSETLEKVVVLLQTKYKNAKSFIRQGPVEYVRMKNKNNVIYFNNNIDEAVEKIKKYLRNRFWYLGYKRKEPKLKDLNLISGQSATSDSKKSVVCDKSSWKNYKIVRCDNRKWSYTYKGFLHPYIVLHVAIP